MDTKTLSVYVYTCAMCTGDCIVRDEDPGVVPLTTIIAAVCSVAVASLLLLVAVITILTIWKLKYR